MLPRVSVVIASLDRPHKLEETVSGLRQQTLGADQYEVVVVDDGSTPPLALAAHETGPTVRVLRLPGGGRSAARNAGANAAQGALLVFLDDDISVGPTFLEEHTRAHAEWPGALIGGPIRLPVASLATPFGRFRQAMEDLGVPRERGLFRSGSCAAGNLSIPQTCFDALGGFDGSLASGEDQDLAMRHVERTGPVAFVPEAPVVHRDDALDIRTYCRRVERGSEFLVAFCRKHPDLPANRERQRVHGPLALGREAPALSVRKVLRSLLATRLVTALLLGITAVVERTGPTEVLHALYRALLGVHIFRGYRRGLASRDAHA